MRSGKLINYGDAWSTVALWMKAALLFPLWWYLFLPFVGFFVLRFGNTVFVCGYPILIIFGLGYFIEDVLRRKVYVDDHIVSFGYEQFQFKELKSVGLVYKANKTLPTSLLLYFGKGRKLELRLSRLSHQDCSALLALIENRIPDCEIDPVVRTLTKSKTIARKAAMDEGDRTEIVYQTRRVLKEMKHTFMQAAQSWSRLGPSIALFFCAPAWLTWIYCVYASPASIGNVDTGKAHEQLVQGIASLEGHLSELIGHCGTALFDVVSDAKVVVLLSLFLIPIFYYLLRFLFLPNRLVLDQDGVELNLSVGRFWMPLAQAKWSQVVKVSLSKPSHSSGPEKSMIVMQDAGQRPVFRAELAALESDDRTRLSKAIERWAPHCVVDAEVAETLMPRQAKSYTELWLQSLSASPERACLDPLAPGRVLQEGRYEVVRRIGVGGQGAAYQCIERTGKQPASIRNVVLKETIFPVFVESTIRQQALERFEQEARILNSLDDGHIVRLLDYFVEDHRGYLALELVDGKSLRQIVEDRGVLPALEVRSLALQMCEILGYLHGKSVIHRDFTPENLILQKDGKLRLIDFNVAQQEEEGSAGVVVGKHAYLPPEQFRGKPTAQSDIYAMGATLFFLLKGVDPEPITQSNIADDTTCGDNGDDGREGYDQLAEVVSRCTALDTGKRFKHVLEIENILGSGANAGDEPARTEEQGVHTLKAAVREAVLQRNEDSNDRKVKSAAKEAAFEAEEESEGVQVKSAIREAILEAREESIDLRPKTEKRDTVLEKKEVER